MPARTLVHHLLSLLISLSLVLPPSVTQAAGLGQTEPPSQTPGPVWLPFIGTGQNAAPTSDLLYRVQIAVSSPARWQRLEELGVVILERDDISAIALVDFLQLEQLAKLQFQPRGADELSRLVNANGEKRPWLARAMRPVLEQAAAVRRTVSPTYELGASSAEQLAALDALRASLNALTVEERAALADSFSLDDDGDGLTNTEESWWCTDPLNPNSDGDAQGHSDGKEVAALLDVTVPRAERWGYGPPYRAWPPFVKTIGVGEQPTCLLDSDEDSIPDLAEIYVIGTRVPAESTDFDKFDDGQELFGVTRSEYGHYPRAVDSDYITAEMPRWVLPPGDSPFVAAFPIPEVHVLPDPATGKTWNVERVTRIETAQGEMVQKTASYETSVTRGESTSIANTVTWNEWEEVSQAIETPVSVARVANQPTEWKDVSWGKFTGGTVLATGGTLAGTALLAGGAAACVASVLCGLGLVGAVVVTSVGGGLIYDEVKEGFKKDDVETQQTYSPEALYCSELMSRSSASSDAQSNCDGPQLQDNQSVALQQNLDYQGISSSLDGVQYAINQQGALLSRGLQDISYQISRPRLTETKTNGKSWGGAQTTTHEVYEEHTITQGEAFTSGQNWSTAWAVDSSHAADLTFRYAVQNAGTEYAKELTNLVFNIYIGDDKLPAISYPAWEQFADGKLGNLFPVGPNTPPGVISSKVFASNPIPLSLEQMKRIDLGERLTVKVENFSFGADENFYVAAISGGVTVFIEDGVEDGDETVDQYVIPTWGVETVQDVLTRYFPAGYDADGNLNALWTPEFNGDATPAWNEHFLSDIAWWNVYLTQADAGDTPLHLLPARSGSGILFRFNRDSDRDGYNDRAEFRYYCALPNSHAESKHCADGHLRPEIHPQPELLAGYVVERNGNVATVKLALENTGSFDAYGIDAVLYSPDETTTIGNNTVGGNGVVRAGRQVVVGSLIKAPSLGGWLSSRSKPYAAGQFSGGADRTFTFSAQTPGVVGTGSTAVAWNDGAGNSGVLNLGSDYHAPLPLDVAQGLQVGFNTGTIDAGASFTVTALTPRDTFTFTINSEPFTPPVVVVSYSDPQGSRRFVTPVELPWLGDALSPHAGQMLKGLAAQIVTTAPFTPSGQNRTSLVVNSPHPATIVDGHLHLNFVSDGKLVLEKSYTMDFPPGPTTFTTEWAVSEFSADYKPAGDNLLIAFWTDSENNIIDSAARPLNSFAADPKPVADSDAALWNFGTVTQGEVLKRSVSIASVGDIDLLAYVAAAPGLSVSQSGSRPLGLGDVVSYELTLDTRTLPTGPYTGTATLRTSDPAHPLYTVQVTGEIAPLVGDAYARRVEDRPLDVEVWVGGPHKAGDSIQFQHELEPNKDGIHPVKVFSDNQTLVGVGEFAVAFTEGPMPYSILGTGADGDYVVDSDTTFDTPRTSLAQSLLSGQTVVPLVNGAGFSVGDELIIYQTQGTGAGTYEFSRILTIQNSQVTVQRPLLNSFVQGGASIVQVMRVPNFRNVLVTATGRLRAPNWNGNTGGLLVFRVRERLVVDPGGVIDSSGKGFRGTSHGAVYRNQTGVQGEGFLGTGGQTWNPNASGGGGGQGTQDGGGGGGGGYGTSGGAGATGQPNSRVGGAGGQTVGSAKLEQWFLGGAGGEGGADEDGGNPGGGGFGGGVVALFAKSILINGSIHSNGSGGGNGCQGCGGGGGSGMAGGGGGSGGSIFISGYSVSLNTTDLQANGGSGGAGVGGGGYGGHGGQGRIRIEYCSALNGSIPSSISSDHIQCAIAYQINTPTGDDTKVILPEDFDNGYNLHLQYGHKVDFAALGGLTIRVRMPDGKWLTSVFLDALVSGMGSGDATLKLDIGNDGVWDWEVTRAFDNSGVFSSPNLASAFAPYVGGEGEVDVEVKVYLSKPGQVLLTNMAVTRERSVELRPQFALSGTPTEGAVVPLNATVVNTGTADSGPLTVSYYAAGNALQGNQYIGSVFVSNVTGGGSVPAPYDWNTLGFVGPITVTATVDPFNRTPEVIESNNSVGVPFTLLTRPDLAFNPSGITLSDDEPVVGETVTVTASLKNSGQTQAGSQKTVLYRGNPESGGVQLQPKTVSAIGPGANRAVAFTWTPTTTGWHRLFVRTDKDAQVNESDEGNNDRWVDVYVGVASPLDVDSGAAADTAYSQAQGFGAVDTGQSDEMGNCGSAPYQTFRRDPSGQVNYRFDHLQPGHYYHLDLTLYECGQNAGRQQRVFIDGAEVAGPVDLGSGDVQALSLLIDPALYADRTISVTVSVDGSGGALVNRIALVDVDYRYADAGGTKDVKYPGGALPYGWLDGVVQTPWGTLPYQSLRENQSASEVRYQFDALQAGKEYQLHFSFFQGSGNNRVQQIWVDEIPLSGDFTLVAGQRNTQRVDLPKESYSDGSIVVAVRRSDGATTGAMINEIALEEVTQPRTANCRVTETPSWTVAYGSVTISGQPAPVGAIVTAENPRGDVVGCFVVINPGQYGFVSIYGEDRSGTPILPGMQTDEPVIFRVNGVMAVPTPLLTWQDNKTRQRIDLAAGVTSDQYLLLRDKWNLISTRMTPPVPLLPIVLQSIAGKYCLALGQRGIYDCTVPAAFQSLKGVEAGKAYYVKVEGGASVNLVIEGVPLAADAPLALEKGLNWVGYLPSGKLPIGAALQSISAPLVQVADGQGRIYDPAEPGFSNLLEMTPGHGYLIHVNQTATLTYPGTGAAVAEMPAEKEAGEGTDSIHCAGVEPTPYFTAIYGRLAINGVDAAIGDRVEVLTPRGEVAGCFTVTTPGQYGFLSIFGAEGVENGLPGFLDSEPIALRVNGAPVELTEPLIWRDDKSTHRLDIEIITADWTDLFLPFTSR